jgi:hypothetical protein
MRALKAGSWLATAAVTALAAACGTDAAECVAGRQVECSCGEGATGFQVCNDDGASFGPCSCDPGGSTSTAGTTDAGTTTTGAGGEGGSGATTTATTGAGAGGAGGGGTFDLVDSLKDFQPKGSPVGGAFSDQGWTVQQKTDRIYYALPRLIEGSIAFTISGVTTQNLDLADHEIFSMYDAGHGITEPINYNPEFRDNHYKQLIRIYGQQVPDRFGLQKYVMLMCPDGAPGYGACQCAKSYYDGDGTWGGDPNWDGSPSRITVTWGDGKATYSRDGAEVWTNDYTQSGLEFGPEELHFSIGCARHDAVGDAGMPIGAVVSDVEVHGVIGAADVCR